MIFKRFTALGLFEEQPRRHLSSQYLKPQIPISSHARLTLRTTLRVRLDPKPSEKRVMGAGGKFQYPKEVWSPAGGWWPYPKKWRSNTVACFFLIAGLCVPVFMASERLTVRVKFIFLLSCFHFPELE